MLHHYLSGSKTLSETFAAPNPNDSIPTAPAPTDEKTNGNSNPTPPVTVPIPNGDALDTMDTSAANGAAGVDEEGAGSLDALGRPIPTEELFVKDAFLVFRALCKLSMKPLVTER